MKYTTIIKKGTKDDPIYMEQRSCGCGKISLEMEDDNLPVFQPFPEYIDKDELEKQGGELIELNVKII